MASGGAEEDDGGIPLDIDNMHMLLQVEHDQIQKRTFTNWINAQLSKRCPPSHVSDLFSDLKSGSQLLDLLEVMTGQPMKRQRGRGVFQQRANIETALNFLKKKSIKMVNINIPDIIDGRPSIILGLIWTIILHCHIEELASTLSYSSCHSSLDSLTSLDSFSGSPVPASPVHAGRTSPLHKHFRISAKKALLMWVKDQCQRAGCSLSVKDFKKSWRSGEAFLAILCSLRPQLVDLSLVRFRSNQENLEEAFHLAERELHIPRLLEPQDVDVKDPDEKSIMTYVAQFLQYSNDMPSPDDHLQVPQSERALEVTAWLQQAYQDLSEARTATEHSSFAEKYQVFQKLSDSFTEQRKPVMTLLAAVKRCPELSQEQRTLRTAWDRLEEELQRCKADLDSSLPPPLDSVVVWLQRAEAALTEDGGKQREHADAAKDARTQQDKLKTLIKEMSHHVNILDTFKNMDVSGNLVVPLEKFDEVKRRLTNIRVTAKYQGIKLEYKESRHTVLDLLGRVDAEVQTWKAPYRSQETVTQLLQDWHETMERQGQLLILMDALQKLQKKANAYTSKAALSEDSQIVTRQVKEAEREAELIQQAVTAVRGTMERVASEWETYNDCMTSLQTWLTQQRDMMHDQDMSKWTSCQARLNEAGNFLIEVTDSSASLALTEQLRKINMQWAERVKRTKFGVSSESSVGPLCLQTVPSLTQEASFLLNQPLEVSSVPLKAKRQKLQLMSKKMTEVDLSSLSPSTDFTPPQVLAEAERTCGELQRAASRLEGRLAELNHWSTETLDCYQQLKEKKRKGRPALKSTAKVLISRGLQLENQVVTEGQDLQDLVAQVQKTSPLQHLSTSDMQDRISEAVNHCQEILGMFSSLGFQRPVGAANQTQKQPEPGAIVVARTKHVDKIGNVSVQTHIPNQFLAEFPSQLPQQRAKDVQQIVTQDEPTIVIPRVQILPQPLREPVPQIHSPLTPTRKDTESHPTIQPQSFPQTFNQAPSPSFSELVTSTVSKEKESSHTLQTNKSKSRSVSKPKTPQTEKKPPLPPAMDRSEVHSKAQSMAKSRLLKARFHLQGRIQQAINLFGGRDISDAQAKRKQKALKVLQPAVLEEFLGAVEGFGAFCTGSQLQEVIRLSDSVRKQWEDVRREIAAFVPVLRSQIRAGEQSFSVVQCETQTNNLHEATDQTDHGSVLQQRQAVTDEDASVEERAESLQELCDTLTPGESSLATDPVRESEEVQETQPSDTMLTSDNRGRQLWGNTPLRATGTSADTQRSSNPPQEQHADSPQQDLSPMGVAVSVQPCRDVFQVRAQDVPAENKDDLRQSKSSASGKNLKPALKAKEEQLTARLLHITGRHQPTQAHIQLRCDSPISQAVVRGNTVETKQEPEWTVIPETAAPHQEELSPEQEVLERLTSVEKAADLMDSADLQVTLTTETLDWIIRKPIDISSLTLPYPDLVSDLQEMDVRLQSELKKLTEEERRGQKVKISSSLSPALHSSVHHLEQLRQRLEKVQSAALALDHFLVTVREAKAEIPTPSTHQDSSRQQNEADWKQDRQSWQQKLQRAAEQADSLLKTAGMTLSRDGSAVTCRDVVTFSSQQAEEKESMSTKKSERNDEIFLMGQKHKEGIKELNPLEVCRTKSWDDSSRKEGAQEQKCMSPSALEEESELEAKRRRLEGDNETNAQRANVQKDQTCRSEETVHKAKDERRRRSSQVKREEERRERLVQRRAALIGALKEMEGAAEQLGLKEPTLPALQQRTRALKDLESRLAGLHAELQHLEEEASEAGFSDGSQTGEVEEVWEATTKAVTERLERCRVLTELLKRFQSLRGELSGTLQRAESAINEQASYMGKENLQRLHTKVRETKTELSGLGDRIEEVRSVCRQLHTHLRQIPECTTIPFEEEAHALMDRWLDISERTDSHLENLHLGLTRWEGVFQLGAEVENWTTNKLAVFAESPSFQTEEDITALQNEILAQEENTERFQRRASEVQMLLQSAEPPLELQVVETQMRKKIKELKELASEAEDVHRQMVAAKEQVTARMAECANSLQKIQDSLLTLRGSDVPTVLAKLKDLLLELQTQDEQAESVLGDLSVISSIAKPLSLQSLSVDGMQLQDKVRNTHQLFSEVEEQTQRNIQDLDRLQREGEHLARWLQAAEERAGNEEGRSVLQDERLQQRERTKDIHELVSSLQNSNLQESPLVEEGSKLLEKYNNVQTNLLGGSSEKQSSLSRNVEASRTLSKSTQPSVADLRPTVASVLGESVDTQNPEDGRLQRDRAVKSAMAEEEARLGEGKCSRLEESVRKEHQIGELMQDCQRKLASLQEKLSAFQPEQKESSAALITDAPALEALLQEVADVEKDLLQIVTLKDSISGSATAEARASLSQQVGSLQSHKRALDDSVRESLARLTENRKQRVKQVEEEICCVQTAMKELMESLDGNLCGSGEVLPDIRPLKQQWHILQGCETRLEDLAAKVSDLQKTGETNITHETHRPDVMLSVETAAKDLDSLRSVVLQSKQECVENTADRVRQDISRLQEWSQTAEPSSPSQAVLDEGFLLQHSLREVLSDKDFLLNCLGSQVSEELQKSASEALSQSARTLQEFTKSPFGTELNRDLSIDVAEEIPKSESKTTLTSPEETPAMHPPASPSHSATDHKEKSASNQYDNRIQTKDILGKAKEDTNQYPNVDVSKSKTKQESQLLTSSPPRTKREACVEHRDETDTLSSGIHPLSSEHRTAKPDNSPPFTPENVSEHLTAQTVTDARTQQKHGEDSAVTPKKVFTIMLEMDPRDMQVNENAGPDVFGRSQGVFDSKPVSSVGKISPESEKSEAQSDTFKAVSDAQEKEKFSVDISETQKKVLDTEAPEFQSVDMPQRENVGACSPDIFSYSTAAEINDAKLTQDTMVGVPEEKSRPVKTITSPESDDKNVKIKKSLTLNESQAAHSQSENSMRVVSAGLDDVSSSASANSSFQETRQVKQDEVLNPSNPCGSVADRQLGVARAAETSFPSVRREEMTDFCPAEGQTMSSFLCCVEGENVTETQIPVSENTQQAAAQSTSPGVLEMTERETKEDLKLHEAELLKAPERQDEETLPTEEREPMVPASPEDREVAQTQPQITESMEPERTAPGLKADPPAGETSGGSQDSRKHKSTMQDILTDIQSLVERSNIINRTPHIDLNWYLKSSPGEPEIRLVRTVQKVLACRYQPAQLDIKEMAKQLQDAEDYRRCVQDQVAAMKSKSGARVCAPDALKSVEAQCSAALLDASATVQVKAAQLDQVKRYQREMKIIRAFLAVVAVEKEKMSLDISGSSALQASKLNGLLQTMVLKKGMMEELLRISSQLSVHLSDAESSGALLAQLGDVQEEWRLLEGSVKRALQHTSSSTSQFSLLIKDTKQLKAKLEALQTSSFESNDSKSALESVCLITDLKLFSQLYLHLQSESEALVQFSLGQKEKDEIKRELQEVGSLINVTKSKLDISTYSSSAKINRQLQDLITWAKQAENHISIGKKLALFPEEARIQIVEMKKFQTDILSRRSKMQAEVEQMKDIASGMETEESDQVFKTVEDLYVAITDSLGHVLDTMKKDLKERETMLCQLASMDAWLAEMHAKRDPCTRVDNVSKANIRELEIELKSHKFATVKIESTIKLVEGMAESCKEIAAGLGPGESRYLVNRLSGLWTELDGLLALEKATSWELEELIHERTSSDEELSTIQACLENISTDLKQQMFPLTHETISKTAQWKHMLMEHQCQVQEIQHCQEAQRSSLLCTIGELQDQCKALSSNAFEQEKYLHMRSQMEASRDITEEQIQRAKDKDINLGQRFRQCQTLLVELPLVKTQCQEAADQLEAIAQELNPTELNSERQRIRQTVETLVSWENSVTDDIKNLEAKLLLGLRFSSELPALIQFFQSTRAELEGAKPVDPEEKAIDIALRRCWVIWRNMESGMRVLEGLGRKDKTNLKHNKELYSLRDATMHECHVRMESLSQARESLKDYQWAAQGAISFLHNAEATFLSAPGGFLDCTEEQRQTQQALETLEDGFQAHIRHLFELVPKQPCLSLQKTEQLHINIFSQLLVGRALLEAQAQLRLESLERCEVRQQSHRRCHEDIRQHLSGLEAQLSECAGEQVTSYDRCVAQQKRATLLMEDLCCLAGKTEELRAGCPMQGCVVGKDGELGALWRRWVSLRRGIGFLMAHTEQRGEEWKDITTSMEQCCSFLASLQAEVPDSSTVSFIKEEPQELLAQAEMHQAGLEQEQQALASLEHRLEHALSLSSCHDPVSPGPVGKTLVKIQDNVRSLKERNLQVVAAAQAEEKERQQVQEEIEEVEQHVLAVLTSLEASSNPSKQQELRKDLSSQKTKLQSIMAGVQSRYAEIPPDINRRLQEVQLSLRREEEKLVEKSISIRKLNSQVAELGSGLEKVKMLLEQQSPTVPEAQKLLKRVWDELDRWHSRLMLLECEVQDLAEEHPDQAHLLIDQLTQPLQFYQNTAQLAEQRTAFLSKIPCCLQEFEDIVNSATCWLGEAQSWLSAPSSFTTARSIQNHANSLQLVLDDSERIRSALQDFRPVLDEVSAVCDMSTQKEKLDQNDQQVKQMQSKILEPLEQLLQAVEVVEETETELKTMEKNVQKIRAILSSMDNSNITLTEHLQNRQVILANVQSMQRTLEEMERCKGDLQLPQGAEESLLVFSRAKLLLQQLKELEQLTQQQATVLEENIREEDVSITKVFDSSEGTRSRQIGSVQEAAEVSEEEEDEENRSCHSSSSDTLTCSIPEDPEDTLDALDVQSQDIDEREPLSEAKKLESLPGDISTDVKMSSEDTETSSVKPELDSKDSLSGRIDATLMTMEYKADVGEAFGPDTAAAEDEVTAATTLDRQGSPQHETLSTDPQTEPRQAAAAVEDRGLIPVTPSADARASERSTAEEDKDQSLDLVHVLKKQQKDGISQSGFVEESVQAEKSPELQISSAGREEKDTEQRRWSQLYTQISQKVTTLKKVKEEPQELLSSKAGATREKDPEKEMLSSGSASSVLHGINESSSVLRQIVSSADGSHPGVSEELYDAVRKVLLSLSALTDFLLTPRGSEEDDDQLRLIQQECVSAEMVTVSELLSKVESDTKPMLSSEEPEALQCLTSLQDGLQTVQLISTSSRNQLLQHLGMAHQHQELPSNRPCLLDEFEQGKSEIFPGIKEAPSLELCVLGRHLREGPGEKVKLQQASRSLLQGTTRLLELGEECFTERQMNQVQNRCQLQAVLCRHKKLLQVLRSQLAFVQHLFQREPEALECQEDERVQLEVRAKALQQQALGLEAASQRGLQEWNRWEDNCGRLGRLLDDVEAFISSEEPEGDDEELVKDRSHLCQQTLVQLDESRAALGLLLDQRKLLQTEPTLAAAVSHAGSALEQRWQSAYRWTEQEIQRCRDIQDSRTRFHTDFTSVSDWLVGANKRLKNWSNLADTSELSAECVHSNLIELLDFSMEVESQSVQRASVSRDASQLLHLREADCPGLRAQLSQLDSSWSQLTSDLSKIQERLQQRLLTVWPPLRLLCDLEDWLRKQEARLNRETDAVLKAEDAAHITEHLQHYQELKVGVVNGQLLLDFLCQSGPRVVGRDVHALRFERTKFAEDLGALRLKWLHVQRELQSQIREAEQIHHTCADRERRLQHLKNWTRRQKKQLDHWKQPSGQSVARKALQASEDVKGRVKKVTAALQKLKLTRVCDGKDEEHTCDVIFSGQTERVCEDCDDLGKQIEALTPALRQTAEEWGRFESDLREASLHTTRARCFLQHQRAPLFSLKQAEGDRDILQQLQEKAEREGEIWASLDKSCRGLVKNLHHVAAQGLSDQMERERKRWKDVLQDLKDEHVKAAETLSLWQEYTQLSDQSVLSLQRVKTQCEELLSSSPQQDTQDVVQSVEKLQEAAEDLQRGMGDVLSASKPVIGRLQPLAGNFIQSETRLLSRDILLLSQAISGRKKHLQEDLEQQELLHARLEAFEKQTQEIQDKINKSPNSTDSVKQVLFELSDLFAPLIDVREMSVYGSLNNKETDRLHTLSRQWVESLTHMSDMNRELQAEHQRSLSFQEKCENLTSVQKKLEEELMSKTPQSYSSLQEMLSDHQKLELEMINGHQLLHSLLCQALESMETEAEEKRSELIARVTRTRKSWFNTVALAGERRSSIKEQVGRWRLFNRGSKIVWKLLRDVDPLLPPAGPTLSTLHQLQSCTEDYQCVEEALRLHSSVYTQTMEAGRQLCDAMADSECQSRLLSELQATQEAWERTSSLLERRRDLVNTNHQKWSQCQEGISGVMSDLDEMKNRLTRPERPQDSEEEKHIQETELSLQRLNSGLRDLTTMKTDLSQYVAAADSALLEQQLEQLHGQWEELCTKVSLRRQEIADRLNAWTIFNDKNKEFCDWLTQMENKVCHSGDLSIEEMVEKLKKDCMEEINLFSENKSHLKQLGEQLLLASDEAKQSQVHSSLQEVNQRWHHLFHHIEARVKKLKETLVTMQQLDKNMSNLRSWLSRIESELSRPITYSVCHHQEIQKRLAEQQELQRDIEQHTAGVASVLSLCDVLLRDEDAAGGGGTEAESDSLQETSRSLDQRWRTICALAQERRLRIGETWGLWCKFLDDYSRFEDWLKMAERTAASPNSADVLYTVAKEELKKFEGFQRQVHERLTQLELVNNQYRRLARENRTDRASQLKAMVHEGNRRWDTLHRRVSSILRRLKYFTSQREDFEGTRESMLVWLTELDLQLTNVEHFSESDVHQKIQQLNSFQKEITLNTERIDGLIVFGEGLIQKSSPQDAALIEDELEELHSYCQEVFSRLVRFHQRLSQPPVINEEPELSSTSFSLESSLELIGRPWLGRSLGSFPATPTHLLAGAQERSGRETPVSVDSLPLEWDHTGDVGGSSSHEDEEEEEEEAEDQEDGRTYFSAHSEVELMESLEEFFEAREALRASSLVCSSSMSALESPRWRSQGDAETQSLHSETPPTLTSTPLKPAYLRLMSQCSGSIENIKRVSLILDDEEQPEELGLTGLTSSDKQSGVIERWELLKAQSRSDLHADSQESPQFTSDLDDITSWLESVIPHLERLQQSEPAVGMEEMAARAKELKEMQKTFTHYKSIMLSVNLQAQEAPELQERLAGMNRDWSQACTGLQQWDTGLRKTLMQCQEFHESLHSLLLWLAHAESQRYAVDISHPDTSVRALQQHHSTLTDLQTELRCRQTQQASLQALWYQLQPEDDAEESDEAQEKLHVTRSKLKLLLRQVGQDLGSLQQRLECVSASEVQGQSVSAEPPQEAANSKKSSSAQRERRASSPPRSFFYRVLRAAFPLHLLLLFLLLLPCLIPMSESDPTCTTTNNFARSFYPMLRYTNGPPPT